MMARGGSYAGCVVVKCEARVKETVVELLSAAREFGCCCIGSLERAVLLEELAS